MSRRVRVAYAWSAQDDTQLSVQVNDYVLVDPAADASSGWIFCVAAAGGQGAFGLRDENW